MFASRHEHDAQGVELRLIHGPGRAESIIIKIQICPSPTRLKIYGL